MLLLYLLYLLSIFIAKIYMTWWYLLYNLVIVLQNVIINPLHFIHHHWRQDILRRKQLACKKAMSNILPEILIKIMNMKDLHRVDLIQIRLTQIIKRLVSTRWLCLQYVVQLQKIRYALFCICYPRTESFDQKELITQFFSKSQQNKNNYNEHVF